jgi:hypothetical protein
LSPDGHLAFSGAIPKRSNAVVCISLDPNANQLLVMQYGVIELWDIHLRQRLASIDIAPATASLRMWDQSDLS